MSIGDAMRDLDTRAILANDFLIVYGDIISNLPLDAAMAAHRERRSKDKNAIMTMVLREAGTNHRTKAQDVDPVFVIDPTKDRCVHYEQMQTQQTSKFVNIDPDILKEHDEIEVRQDLIDCGIDICTPDVLALWSDNFDYEYPRRGFLHSVLKDYELNGKTIHTHIVNDHYAARVKNLSAYGAVSKDVVGRWAYPICPDTNLLSDHTYTRLKGNVYREEGVTLARSCHIGPRTVIGRATVVGEGSVISNSVIGQRCVIGRNVKIDGAYIWDDAFVGDGSVIQDAVIANEASVGKRCKVMPGALLSYGVHISDNVTVREGARITRMKRKRGYDTDEIIHGETDTAIVGDKGTGFGYVPDEDEDEDNQPGQAANSIYNLGALSLSQESISTLHSEDDWSEGPSATRSTRTESFGSIGSAASEDSQIDTRAAMDFHHDAAASIYDSLQKGDDSSNIQLELTALRMSADASPSQVRRAVIAAFMKRIAGLVEEGSSPAQAVKKTIPVHKMLLERTLFDRGEDHESKGDQVDFLLLVQSDLCHRKDGEQVMLFASNELVMNDVVDAEGFEQWWADERSLASEELKGVRSKMGPFMEAILADSESSSEEEESGSEEEEEDDDDEDEDEDEDDEEESDE